MPARAPDLKAVGGGVSATERGVSNKLLLRLQDLSLTLGSGNLSYRFKVVLAGSSSARKSETQVFPTFLFAGTIAHAAHVRPYESRFYSRIGILGT
jgi:hypothetical protein